MTIIPKIAVVGGGPAGLAAASEAARAGLTVHLYEHPATRESRAHPRARDAARGMSP
jgi:2-polyprenyl-6-methoxyphenol hydroxylase-like FAD-dependent oxidoreductase